MKKIIFCLLLLWAFISVKSLGQCLQNGDFANTNCGNNLLVQGIVCGYFANNCVPNWVRSHGTPSINIIANNPILNTIYMWSSTNNQQGAVWGEGIVGGFNFIQNVPYQISVGYTLSQTLPANATLNIRATNGLTMTPGLAADCGEPIPNPANSPFIASDNLHTNLGFQNDVYNFTATNGAYNKIWIYPTTNTTNQCELVIDYVFICPDTCGGTVSYNLGEAPSGRSKFFRINAGSSSGTGGSGIVTVSQTVNTDFLAIETIDLVNDFDAIVTGTTEFNAMIVPCSTGTQSRPINHYSQPYSAYTNNQLGGNHSQWERKHNIDSTMISQLQKNNFSIYPNPASDIFYINNKKNIQGKLAIQITDINGQIVHHLTSNIINPTQNRIPVKIDNLIEGIYFVVVKSDLYSETLKLIISRH
ncbi:MAG: T9SS type A sorting domain-containing protein [Chitinophagaceae bacterium]|nr:T9SS type A sorting domain-containing protein [Chitinophagaceae bacterium]